MTDMGTMDPAAPERIVEELLPVVRAFSPGPCGVALGGSHAKGSGDAHSDVDVYLFADAVVPAARRREIVVEALGPASEAVSWGADDPWVQGGTDFVHRGVKVECWLRSAREVERALQASLRGELRREIAVWAVMGFFDHVVLADVRSMRVVDDPDGTLARWKDAVREYPEALRRAILGRFAREAAFWPGNVHYRTAVARGDVIYAAAIVQQVAQALVQGVFALNREPFPGEKRLARALDTLRLRPEAFAARLEALLWPAVAPDPERLEAQRRALAALVDEVDALVAAERG